MNNLSSKKFSFSTLLKNLFFILLILQFAPGVISSIKNSIDVAISKKVQVGLLSIEGMISDSAFFTKRIEEFEKNDQIKAVLIKINSPGGFPGSSQAIYRELHRLKAKKPIVALIENVCASAGYHIASAAHKIIANPSSMVGSIGAIAQLPNVKGLLDSWNVQVTYIAAGKYKATGAPVKELTGEEKEYLQGIADDTYRQFIADVAESRNIPIEQHTIWAEGKVFTGNQAKKLNLIDEIGSFRDAVAIIKELASIKEDVKFVVLKKRSSWLMRFLVGEEESSSEYSSEASSFLGKTLACAVSVAFPWLAKQDVTQVRL